MPRATLVRAVIALAVLACSGVLVLTKPPRLGLDLRGGTQIVLETRDSPTVRADAAATEQTLEVLRRRVDALGVSEPTLTRSGQNRIIVELPGLQDPAEAERVIGRTAQLSFHPVLAEPAGTAGPAGTSIPDETGQPIRIGPAALEGGAVRGARAYYSADLGTGWQVSIDFTGDGGRAWQRLTGAAACAPPGDPARRVAIVLDTKVISSPQVNADIGCETGIAGGSTVITGRFAEADAKDLAVLIRGGALPVPVQTVGQRTVGATLGDAAIDASVRAALIGAGLTVLFVLAVYRLSGALAAIALGAYGLISYAALLAIGATLTLPGVAGFVLAIGMAVDANVLVFERAREEYAASGRLRRSVRDGFRNAFSAIADSNATTLLAAGLLFWLASGPVRGFGVTLSVGVLASVFAALVLTRALLELTVAAGPIRRRPQWTGLAGAGSVRRYLLARQPDLMRRRRRWLGLSGLLVAVAIAGVGVRGLNLGVEFTGGRLIEYSTSRPVPIEAARDVVAAAGQDRAVVQTSGDREITVRGADLTDAQATEIRTGLAARGGATEQVRDEFIGPSLGDELRRKAVIGLVIALAAQLVYLAVRFRLVFGVAAVLAMTHDVLILVGVFAWLGKPVDGVFLAALLTVIGYSVNDSVVVFDRIRELLRGRNRNRSVAELANLACLQTVPRTVNTGLGAVFILVALAILGGGALTDFALALLIGIGIGTYSSVFTATPLAVELLGRTAAGGGRRRAGRPGPGPGPKPAAKRPARPATDKRPVPRGVGRSNPHDSGARV
ncbi:MAG TPA: protein translocase subunit SecD [Mycobacteriales bacterium]|nr:protein translocase subunit SecD [Mycobacteriales bacterium]